MKHTLCILFACCFLLVSVSAQLPSPPTIPSSPGEVFAQDPIQLEPSNQTNTSSEKQDLADILADTNESSIFAEVEASGRFEQLVKKKMRQKLVQEKRGIRVEIPNSTVLLADTNTLTELDEPELVERSEVVSSNKSYKVFNGIVTLGKKDATILFDKPVEVRFPDIGSQPAGMLYSNDNHKTWNEIAECVLATPEVGKACYEYLSSDQQVKLITYHFTDFIVVKEESEVENTGSARKATTSRGESETSSPSPSPQVGEPVESVVEEQESVQRQESQQQVEQTNPSQTPRESTPPLAVQSSSSSSNLIWFIIAAVISVSLLAGVGFLLSKKQKADPRLVQLKAYVTSCKQKGYSPQAIRQQLVKSRVDQKTIDQLLR